MRQTVFPWYVIGEKNPRPGAHVMTSGKFPPLIRNSDNHVIHWSNIILIISKMIADCHHSWSRSLGRPGVTGKTGRLAPNGSVPFYGESTSDQGWRFRLRAAGTPLVMV